MDAEEYENEPGFVGEARWPMAGAVLAAILLTFLLPSDVRIFPVWVLPSIEALLLVALVAGDPGEISRRSRQLRWLSIVLVALLLLASLLSTILLVASLIQGGDKLDTADSLLAAGAVVWGSNVLAFSLLFWELDCGGAAERAHRMPPYPDFAFVQQINPDLAPPGWRPRFVDYLYLSITNSIALSPTDTMPMTPWAKSAMAAQSIISLLIIGLVIARAVNVLN